MDLGLREKTVIVTAASKGLGKGVARQLAYEGANVLIASRDESLLQKGVMELKEETGHSNIDYAVCDMTKASDIKAMVAKTVSLFGGVDGLVNNSGGPPAGEFHDFTDADWEQAFELNLLSFIRTIREVLPYMKKAGEGRIVNLASSSFKQPIEGLILSNTFRTAIIGLAKTLSQELAGDNILINTVGPGRIATDRVAHLDKINADKHGVPVETVKAQAESAIPLGRYGTPEEFAKVVVFLCSHANSYTTGQAFLVDGGLVKAL
ncbi:3-oxoacyl-[acyl-carrier protein] reductase [Pullulanibacillus pueri]|uniref:Oxidoreductase n=1 Tax=Pullulanibacillus pueri TaxID=1437324 RepID=A0A8J3EK99_9BACL|nr:SDR family oxidoreductase [Pullulanibacillus pueri]MBM7683638.1 3-oxoacyl-[acyl-carrier protein] reductase [Pullulanibacillus pueri]GGH76648.1 oxidoreductase [Pullulanibacillus pueri]